MDCKVSGSSSRLFWSGKERRKGKSEKKKQKKQRAKTKGENERREGRVYARFASFSDLFSRFSPTAELVHRLGAF